MNEVIKHTLPTGEGLPQYKVELQPFPEGGIYSGIIKFLVYDDGTILVGGTGYHANLHDETKGKPIEAGDIAINYDATDASNLFFIKGWSSSGLKITTSETVQKKVEPLLKAEFINMQQYMMKPLECR